MLTCTWYSVVEPLLLFVDGFQFNAAVHPVEQVRSGSATMTGTLGAVAAARIDTTKLSTVDQAETSVVLVASRD